jgi:hypothetical protein
MMDTALQSVSWSTISILTIFLLTFRQEQEQDLIEDARNEGEQSCDPAERRPNHGFVPEV